MEVAEDVSSGFLLLPTEPPVPNLNVMLPVNPPAPPVPPDPPPILIEAGLLSVQPLFMRQFLAEPALTTRRVSSFLHLIPASKPRNLVSCGEHASFKSSLRNCLIISMRRRFLRSLMQGFLELLTADYKLTSLHYSSLQVFEDWTLNVEILVVVDLMYEAFSTSVQPFGLQLSTALCSSQSKRIFYLKPGSQAFGPISPCFMLLQGMVFITYWNYLSRRSLFPCKQEIMMLLNGSLPLIDGVINPWNFRFKLLLPQYEAVNWISFFATMGAIASGLSIWSWWFASQQSIFWKRCIIASVIVDVSSTVGYVENFPTFLANGTRIVNSIQSTKAVALQKAPHSTLSSGLLRLQILADSTVPFFSLRSGLVLIEITCFIIWNLVPLVTPLSCSYNLCTTFCLIVVAFALGGVPKLYPSNTLV